MLKVAITGGMGAGKSTVRKLLERHGAHGIDADEVARAVVEPGTAGLGRVLEAFGADLLDAGGRLRRDELARRAFATEEGRKRLEAILHPLILAEEDRLISGLSRDDPGGVVAVEVPLLVEAGTGERYDEVVLVTAPAEVRRERIARAGRLSPQDAEARMRRQADDGARAAVAGHVLTNDGDPAALEAQVARLWSVLAPRGGGREAHRRG